MRFSNGSAETYCKGTNFGWGLNGMRKARQTIHQGIFLYGNCLGLRVQIAPVGEAMKL